MGLVEWVLALGFYTTAGSWFGAVVESVGTGRFWHWVYRYGVKVKSQSYTRTDPARFQLIDSSDKLAISILSNNEALFRARMGLVGLTSFGTTNPIKGTVESTGSELRFVGRLSVMPVVFIGLWLAMFLPLSVRGALTGDTVALINLVVGCVVAIATVGCWYFLERYRFVKAIENLVAQLDESA